MKKNDNDPRAKLASVPNETREFYRNCLAARANAELFRLDMLAKAHALPVTPMDSIEHQSSARASFIGFGRTQFAADFVAAEAIWNAVKESSAFKDADTLLGPLLDAVAELESREEEERREKSQREGAIRTEMAEAQQRAMKIAENDPAVLAARQRLAELA